MTANPTSNDNDYSIHNDDNITPPDGPVLIEDELGSVTTGDAGEE